MYWEMMLIDTISFFVEVNYRYHSGCVEGLECSKGTYCGSYIRSDECALGCTFEQCLALAENRTSYAFSYRGSGSRWCRMCNQSEAATPVSHKDWGIYTRIGTWFGIFHRA